MRFRTAVFVLALGLVAAPVLAQDKEQLSRQTQREEQRAEFLRQQVEPDATLQQLGTTACVAGMAGTYPCDKIDLLTFMPLSQIGGGNGADLWGWTDPLTGKEYAIIGRVFGTSFVDISNPATWWALCSLATR